MIIKLKPRKECLCTIIILVLYQLKLLKPYVIALTIFIKDYNIIGF